MIAKQQLEARVVARDQEVVAIFWTLVDCPPDAGACWQWRGGEDRYGRPVLRLRRDAVLAVRVASYAVTGRYPTEARFTRSCADPQCVRPSHVRWRASTAVRRAIDTHSDGYGEATAPVHPEAELAALRHAQRAGSFGPTSASAPRHAPAARWDRYPKALGEGSTSDRRAPSPGRVAFSAERAASRGVCRSVVGRGRAATGG